MIIVRATEAERESNTEKKWRYTFTKTIGERFIENQPKSICMIYNWLCGAS
jgi:hypothetical protein